MLAVVLVQATAFADASDIEHAGERIDSAAQAACQGRVGGLVTLKFFALQLLQGDIFLLSCLRQ